MKNLHYLVFMLLLYIPSMVWSANDHPKREFRGAWIATVSNLDWPKTDNSEDQRTELVELLDELKSAGVNAVFLQIRNECDAFYNSAFEPWSYWLTREQGTAPDPYYDPLEFAVEEAHKRGMELHAWINPFRAVAYTGSHTMAEQHVSNMYPDWILTFGKTKMLDPGLPIVREYITAVVMDVVERYDIDGIHFDDYFYPYPNSNTGFPGITNEDDSTFAHYPRGFTDKGDWRRDNVNIFIESIYNGIQERKPYLKFGVSPFGIWKNGVPPGIYGLDAYNEIYCDAVAWFDESIVDYVAPQLYWPFGGSQDYGKLLPWWASKTNGRHLLSGNAVYRINAWSEDEMPNQIRLNRETDNVVGSIFYRTSHLIANPEGFKDSLKNNLYRYPALAPVMPWKETVPPNEPRNLTYRMSSSAASEMLEWDAPEAAGDGDLASRYVVYRVKNSTIGPADIDDARNIVDIAGETGIALPTPPYEEGQFYYAVSSLDRNSNESAVSNIVTVTPPGKPALALPLNGDQNQPDKVILTWHSAPGAVSYLVQLAADSLFTAEAMVEEKTVNDTVHTVNMPEGQKKYYWRVKASNAGGHSDFTQISSFKTGFPTLPAPVSPANFATGIPVSPELLWSSAQGAASYCLQIATQMSFIETSVILDTCGIADTTFTAPALGYNVLYYWRVRAVNSVDSSEWSDKFAFRTESYNAVDEDFLVPGIVRLYPNYPNPFNPGTTISFYLPRGSRVSLKVYDALGREVAVLTEGMEEEGLHKYTFNAAGLASGVYFSRLTVNGKDIIGKMILLK